MNKQVKLLLVERKPKPNPKVITIGDKKFLLIGSGLAKYVETIHSICYREDGHGKPPFDYFLVNNSFAIEDHWLHVEASARLGNGPFGIYGKLCVWYDGKQVGDFKIYRGTIGGGTSGSYPYIVDRDLHIVFWYDLIPKKRGTCSIELYRTVIIDHDYLKSKVCNIHPCADDLTFQPYKLSQLNNIRKMLWFYPVFDEVMNKQHGTLCLYEYPGFAQYEYCIENHY